MVRARLQAGLRGHRLEAPEAPVQIGSEQVLDQGEEPDGARGATVRGVRNVTHRLVKAARGKHIGRRVDQPGENESAHFMTCPNCGAPIDMRDLGQVLEPPERAKYVRTDR
jgi:hypothetical protein